MTVLKKLSSGMSRGAAALGSGKVQYPVDRPRKTNHGGVLRVSSFRAGWYYLPTLPTYSRLRYLSRLSLNIPLVQYVTLFRRATQARQGS